MIDVVYRFDPNNVPPARAPRDAMEARLALEEGNEKFANLARADQEGEHRNVIPLDARALGLSDIEGRPPKQTPFAAILGCADARVPVDLIFHQAINDLFTVRVAGNILGNECLGSVEYAVAHLETIRLLVVLGHSSCGAVSAAVDAYLNPSQYPAVASTQGLRSIVDNILIAVRGADLGLEAALGEGARGKPGYREALVELAVVINAALTAMTMRQELNRDVVFGVYDLVSLRVRVPRSGRDEDHGLCEPPADLAALRELGLAIAGSSFVRSFLDAGA